VSDITTKSASGLPESNHKVQATPIGPLLNTRPLWKELQEGTMLPTSTLREEIDPIKTFIEKNLDSSVSPASFPSSGGEQLEEILFDATSSVKIAMSQVAMHVDRKFRDKLFSQIDALHDLDEWNADDNPIDKYSFVSFIKGILQINPQRYPSLGLSNDGNLMVAWIQDKNRLIVEFLPNDRVEWVISRYVDEEIDRASGETSIPRLLDRLAPYHPEIWFNKL